MIFVTFWGEKTRTDPATEAHIHESPRSMTVPLILLAICSTLGGFLGLPGGLGQIQRFLEPVFAQANEILGISEATVQPMDFVLMAISLAVALLGIALAWYVYVRRAADLPATLGAKFGSLYTVVYNKFYIDEFYAATFVRLAVDGSRWVWRHFDEKVIDGTVNGVGTAWQRAGTAARPIQTGKVQNYLLGIFLGLFVVITAVTVVVFT
jgi:NADH-quinone oxidoreductase subunit L